MKLNEQEILDTINDFEKDVLTRITQMATYSLLIRHLRGTLPLVPLPLEEIRENEKARNRLSEVINRCVNAFEAAAAEGYHAQG
jgi:hypothetical protein